MTLSAFSSFTLLPPSQTTTTSSSSFSISSLSSPSPSSLSKGSSSPSPSEEESQKKIAVSQLQQLPRRKRATPQQRAVLLHVFKKTRFPDTNCRMRLAKELGMTPRSVQVWFQNQRQRTLTRDSPPSFHASSLGTSAAEDSPLSSSPSPSRSPSPALSSSLPSFPHQQLTACQSPSSSPCVPVKPIPSYGAYPSPLISEPSSPDQLSPLTTSSSSKPLHLTPPEGIPFLTLPPLIMNPELMQRQQAFSFPPPFASFPTLPQLRDLEFLSSIACANKQ